MTGRSDLSRSEGKSEGLSESRKTSDTLDIEGVLAGHQRTPALGGPCLCGEWPPPERAAPWTAHVAAVLREQIGAWLGSDDAEESVYEALDPGGHGWAAGDSPSVRETIRALAALVAPSRVPGEET